MAIKVATLKSGEDVIADMFEVVVPDPSGAVGPDDKPLERVVAFKLVKPYVVKLAHPEVLLEDQKSSVSVLYYPWAPLSTDKEFFVPVDWIVTHYNVHSDIVNSYLEKRDGRGNDRHDGTTGGGTGEGNQMYLAEESLLDDNGDTGTES
jgi:hypothetical protein